MWIKVNNKYNIRGQYYYQWLFTNKHNQLLFTNKHNHTHKKIFNIFDYNNFLFLFDMIYNYDNKYIKKFINGRSQGNIRVYFICG